MQTESLRGEANLAERALRRSQVYAFLAGAYLYPQENWSEDTGPLSEILDALPFEGPPLEIESLSLGDLQADHRRVFGAVGSLCYETEYGLPHEFRQSQELADISGFYRAFGFTLGGPVRERPDHLAVELEFMHALALKEAQSAAQGSEERVEICDEAQRRFMQDHLGRWIVAFGRSMALNAERGPYRALTDFALSFIHADAARLDVELEHRNLNQMQPTPLDGEFSCAACLAARPGK